MMRRWPRSIPFPRRDAVVVAALTTFLFFAAVNLQAGWMYAIAALLVGMLGAGWASAAWSVRGVQSLRSAPGEVHEGDEATIVLELRTRRLPRFFLEVTDQTPGLVDYHATVAALWPGRPLRLRYRTTALRRGVYTGGHVTVQSCGLTGWFRAARRWPVPSAVTVFPRLWPVRRLPLPGRIDTSEPVVPQPARFGLDVYGVRDHRDGDSLRHVHWRSTARRGRLVIREYERDARDAPVLLLDTRPTPSFEDLVRAAASVADALAREGHAVRVAGAVERGPAAAGPSRAAVMGWLAAVEPSPLSREGEGEGAVPPSRVYEAACIPDTPVVLFTVDPGSVEYFAARWIPHAAIVAREGDDLRARLANGR